MFEQNRLDTDCPTVTVILPVFNGAATLKRALDSVLAQSLKDIEILVVDDGSTDESLEIAEQTGDMRVRCLRHDGNRGAATARNTGLLQAKGKYIAFIDADDEWMPDKLAKQCFSLADKKQGMAGVCTGYIMQRYGQMSGIVRVPVARKAWSIELLDVCSLAPGATLMVERCVFEDIGLLCVALERFEDWDWLMRYLSRYGLAVVPEPLAIVHSRPFAVVDVVDRSARMLLQRQRAAVRQASGLLGERTFRASLRLEQAIVRWRAGHRVSALLHMGYALVLSPARVGRLVARVMQKIAENDI